VVAALIGLGAAGAVAAVIATRRDEPAVPPPARPPAAAAAAAPGAPASAASPVAAPPAAPPPPPAPVRPPPDPGAEAAPVIKETLSRFVAWSRDHAGAPCPDAAALGAPDDPWGHPLVVTCTEQPGNQLAGAISLGPDGQPGTTDDIASWQLGRNVTDLVRGARWVVAAPVAAHAAQRPHDAPPRTTPAPKPAPVQLDENGLPIAR
jgi:hypothetical protein